MNNLKLMLDNSKKEITDFDNIKGFAVNPVITNLLIQLRDITKIYVRAGEVYEESLTWESVEESLTTAIAVMSLEYRFEADEDYTDAEGDAVNDVIQLMLHYGLNLFHTSLILSNMELWDAEKLNKWISKKESVGL